MLTVYAENTYFGSNSNTDAAAPAGCIMGYNYTEKFKGVNCTFESNTGSYCSGFSSCLPELINCVVSNNTNGAAPQAFIRDCYTATFNNCTFINNSLILAHDIAAGTHYANFVNCSATGNSLFYDAQATDLIRVYNSVLKGTLLQAGATALQIANNAYYNSLFTDSLTNYGTQISANCINSTDPIYTGPDLQISRNSLGINSASNDAWITLSNNVTTDIRGYPRIMTVTIDMGAYEMPIPEMVTYSGKLNAPNARPITINWGVPTSQVFAITTYNYYFGPTANATANMGSVASPSTYLIDPMLYKGTNYFRIRAVNSANIPADWATVWTYFRVPYRNRIR